MKRCAANRTVGSEKNGATEEKSSQPFEREKSRDGVPDRDVLRADRAGKTDTGIQHGVSDGDRILFRHALSEGCR